MVEENARFRKVLYLIENKGIVKIQRERKNKGYSYSWHLTKKGQKIIDENNSLKNLWKEGKIIEFARKLGVDKL